MLKSTNPYYLKTMIKFSAAVLDNLTPVLRESGFLEPLRADKYGPHAP